MRFSDEKLLFGHIVRIEVDGTLLVRLDDGLELSGVRHDCRRSFYNLTPGERVCVSIVRDQPPQLTAYITHLDSGFPA
jgi:hypothetical protein